MDIEQALSPISLLGLPWCETHIPSEVKSPPTIGATWSVCQKVFPLPGVSPARSPLLPIIGHPAFPASVGDPAFAELIKGDKFRTSHFWVQDNWASFPQLQAMPHLAGLGFGRQMQLSYYLRSLPDATGAQRDLTTFESDCTHTGPMSHAISRMHSILLDAHSEVPCKYWAYWERDLGLTISHPDR